MWNLPASCLDSNPLKAPLSVHLQSGATRRAWQPLSKEERMDAWNRSIFIYFAFSLQLSSLILTIFRANWLQIFALMRAGAFFSNFISCERRRRRPPETGLCESLQRCVKGKHVLHSESQGSLSPPYLCDEVFSSSRSQDTGLCTSPNKPVKGSAHVQQPHSSQTPLRKKLFFFLQAPLWVLLVWFADKSHVGEHVVHVCSICPLIRLQGNALKHAL